MCMCVGFVMCVCVCVCGRGVCNVCFFIVWRVKNFDTYPLPGRHLKFVKCPGFWFLKTGSPPVYLLDGSVSEPWSYSALNYGGGGGGKCVPHPIHHLTHTRARTYTSFVTRHVFEHSVCSVWVVSLVE